MKEINLPPGDWLPAPDAPDLFLVSRKGELYSKRTNKIVSQNILGAGYYGHVTKVGGRKGTNLALKTHIQVAKAFHPNPENKPEVNHKNGIKSCNEDWNVEWSTRKENMEHASATGLCARDPSAYVKFSGEDVREILENETCGSSREVGKKYGVSHRTILDVRNNPAHYLDITRRSR